MDTTPSPQPSPGSGEQQPSGAPSGAAQGPGGPPPASQQSQWAPPPQQPSATRSFFDSLRGSGAWRSSERWVGGVCGGLAQRFGIDPLLVRVAVAVLTIFTGLGLVLYCLAWALLPEQVDGRIHLEEALNGRVCAGFVGAATGTVVGAFNFDTVFVPHWYTGLWIAEAFEIVLFVALVALGIWVLVAWLSHPKTPVAPQPFAAGVVGAPAGQPAAGTAPLPASAAPGGWAPSNPHAPVPGPAPQWGPAPGPAPVGGPVPQPAAAQAARAGSMPPAFNAAAAGPGGAPRPAHPYPAPVPAAPRKRPVPGPGRTVSLLVLGLSLLTIAACWLLFTHHNSGVLHRPLVCVGAVVVLLGAGIIVSGLRGRHGGWMSVVGGISAVLLLPGLFLNPLLPREAVPYPLWRAGRDHVAAQTITWQEISTGAVTAVDTGAGTVVVDLTGMPSSTSTPRSLDIDLGVGDLDIMVPAGAPVRLNADIGVGSLRVDASTPWGIGDGQTAGPPPGPAWEARTYTANGDPLEDFHHTMSGLGTKAVLASPGAPVLNMKVDLGVGDVNVYETADSPLLWHGTVIEGLGTWVVDYWQTPDGASGSSLPIPGTAHEAISVSQSQACYEEADPAGSGSGTHPVLVKSEEIKGLTGPQFQVYKDCVLKALGPDQAEAGQPSPGATQPADQPTGPVPEPTAEATPY